MSASNLMALSWGAGGAPASSFWAKSKADATEAHEKATKTAYNGPESVSAPSGGRFFDSSSPFFGQAKQEPNPDPFKSQDPNKDHKPAEEPTKPEEPKLEPDAPHKSPFDDRDRDHGDEGRPPQAPQLEEPEGEGARSGKDREERPGKGREERSEKGRAERPEKGPDGKPSPTQDHVAQHLTAHGVPEKEANHIAKSIAPGLDKEVSAHEKGNDAHVMFYPKGEVAVAIEPRHAGQDSAVAHHGAIALSMDTLKDVHEHGMPQIGAALVRNELGSEVHGMSNLDMVNRFGHDSLTAIEKDGFPKDFVAETRNTIAGNLQSAGVSDPQVSNAQALEVLGDAARNDAQGIQMTDERSGVTAEMPTSGLREQLGFEEASHSEKQQDPSRVKGHEGGPELEQESGPEMEMDMGGAA